MRISHQNNLLEQLLSLHAVNPIDSVNVSEKDFKELWELITNSSFSFKEGGNWISLNNMFSIHLDTSEPDIDHMHVSIISTY